jgi:hypothetical protein
MLTVIACGMLAIVLGLTLPLVAVPKTLPIDQQLEMSSNMVEVAFVVAPPAAMVGAFALILLLPPLRPPAPPKGSGPAAPLPRPRGLSGNPPPLLYYLFWDGEQRGPLGLPQLKDMSARGEIPPGALYTFKGAADWQPIENLRTLLST